jgi:NAD(P)H dehydrogenase (quinone)
MSKKISIVYHSGYGHTEKVANAVAEGATNSGTAVNIIKAENISENDWNALDSSDAIIFGAPTYMGGVSAQFKTFIDAASKKWFEQKWKNKIAAGFTNSGSYSGDKLAALQQLMTNALQHGMIWVGQAEMPPQSKGVDGPKSTDINRLGSSTGLMTQSNNDAPEVTPPSGDIETARIFGKRIAEITKRFS